MQGFWNRIQFSENIRLWAKVLMTTSHSPQKRTLGWTPHTRVPFSARVGTMPLIWYAFPFSARSLCRSIVAAFSLLGLAISTLATKKPWTTLISLYSRRARCEKFLRIIDSLGILRSGERVRASKSHTCGWGSMSMFTTNSPRGRCLQPASQRELMRLKRKSLSRHTAVKSILEPHQNIIWCTHIADFLRPWIGGRLALRHSPLLFFWIGPWPRTTMFSMIHASFKKQWLFTFSRKSEFCLLFQAELAFIYDAHRFGFTDENCK